MNSVSNSPVSPAATAVSSRPPVRRAAGADNGDILGLGWFFGSLHVGIFRRQKLVGQWSAVSAVKSIEELGPALDEALAELKFGGTEAFLLLENERFMHQIEGTPPFSDSVARGYLHARVQRHEKENGPVLWVGQPAAGLKKERSFILHMLPHAFYEQLSRLLLERRLDLTRILPLIVPVQRELDRFPIAKGRPVLVAVEAGGATVVMVAKVGEEMLFARTILASWAADPGRIGVEINRSLLYANQQFGLTVERVWLLGQDNKSTEEVNSKCGTGRQITVLPTAPIEWLQSVAKLPSQHPVNLVAGHLRRKRQQRALRRGLLLASWAGLLLMGVDAVTSARDWQGERVQFEQLRSAEPRMVAERQRLQTRNDTVRLQETFIRQVQDERLAAVPGRFAAFLASVLPPEMRLTELTVKAEEDGNGWTFRLDGNVEADEETAREIVAQLQRALVKSALRARVSEAGRAVISFPRGAATAAAGATEVQRFSLEGVMLEN